MAKSAIVPSCITNRQRQEVMLPEHLYGTRLKVVCEPIIEDDGTVSGVVSFGTSLKVQDSLHSAAQSVSATAEEMNATAEELASNASRLSQDLNKVRSGGETVIAEIQKTDGILRFVSEVADNSNLLGLNAAIEAARAGEAGRGFAVVADEIRKMAINSSQSVQEIKVILQKIRQEASAVVETITVAAKLGEMQAAATREISDSMTQLTSTASELEKIADVSV